MIILGLTGSIGMGKTAAATYLRERGIPVFDADAQVHRLYEGEAVSLVEKAFPGVTDQGKINRKKLSAKVVGNPRALKKLENIVHPLVREAERDFIKHHHEAGTAIVVLEIPLLLEIGMEAHVDATLVVSAPAQIQRKRVLKREGMTAEKFDRINAQQMPDKEKRAKADYVVDSSGSYADTHRQIDKILESVSKQAGSAYRYWLDGGAKEGT